MLSARFYDQNGCRVVVPHSFLYDPDLNQELVMCHSLGDTSVNVAYPRNTVKIGIEQFGEDTQPSSRGVGLVPRYDSAPFYKAPRKANVEDMKKSLLTQNTAIQRLCTRPGKYLDNERNLQYIRLAHYALKLSSTSSLHVMMVVAHKVTLFLRMKIADLEDDELEKEWEEPWGSFAGGVVTLRQVLVRVCNFLCLRFFYPRSHDIAVIAKLYQLKPHLIHTPVSSWLDRATETADVPIPFQTRGELRMQPVPSELNWSPLNAKCLRHLAAARYVFSETLSSELLHLSSSTPMQRLLRDVCRYYSVGDVRMVNAVVGPLLGTGSDSSSAFVEEGLIDLQSSDSEEDGEDGVEEEEGGKVNRKKTITEPKAITVKTEGKEGGGSNTEKKKKNVKVRDKDKDKSKEVVSAWKQGDGAKVRIGRSHWSTQGRVKLFFATSERAYTTATSLGPALISRDTAISVSSSSSISSTERKSSSSLTAAVDGERESSVSDPLGSRNDDNLQYCALQIFLRHCVNTHVSLRSKVWVNKSCGYCQGIIDNENEDVGEGEYDDDGAKCKSRLVCDQCCMPFHHDCVKALKRQTVIEAEAGVEQSLEETAASNSSTSSARSSTSLTQNILQGNIKYMFCCADCHRRDSWIGRCLDSGRTKAALRQSGAVNVSPAVLTGAEDELHMASAELLILLPRSLEDTLIITLACLMSRKEQHKDHIFPLAMVGQFIEENWRDVRPTDKYQDLACPVEGLKQMQGEEEEEEEDIGEAADTGPKKYRTALKALMVGHPAFQVVGGCVGFSPVFAAFLKDHSTQ